MKLSQTRVVRLPMSYNPAAVLGMEPVFKLAFELSRLGVQRIMADRWNRSTSTATSNFGMPIFDGSHIYDTHLIVPPVTD